MDKQDTAPSAPSAPVTAIPVVEYTYLDLSRTQPIPEDFITVGCCAFRCSNFETEKCFGCKSVTQCLCAEEESYVCKMAPGQTDYCCVFGSGACELVNPVAVCKIYRQIFCFELICGCPVQEAYFDTQMTISKSAARTGGTAAEDIIPCSACCCDFTSLYLKWPECCGVYSKSTMMCLEREYVACKPAFLGGSIQNPKQNLLCLCMQGNCLMVPVKTCAKAETQEFCFDYRCALPCDEDVPCLCMPIMFCTCCVNGQCYCGCCQSLQTIRHLGRPPAPNAVATQQPNPASY